MKPVQTIEDVYPAIEELIAELNLAGHSKLAGILHHRMSQVAWTSRSELFEELRSVFLANLQSEDAELPEAHKSQMHQLVQVIDSYLRSSGIQ